MTQTKTTHTPGPWTYAQRLGGDAAIFGGFNILTRDFDEDAGTGHRVAMTTDSMPEADARLIAAAPALLEACKAIAAGLTNGQKERGETLQSIARAAIAAAEGGAT